MASLSMSLRKITLKRSIASRASGKWASVSQAAMYSTSNPDADRQESITPCAWYSTAAPRRS